MGNAIGLGLLVVMFFLAGLMVGFSGATILERLQLLPANCYITQEAANMMQGK